MKIKGKTSSGYEFEINEEIMKDWRFVKKLSKLKELEEDSDSIEIDFINIMSDIETILFDDKGKTFEEHIRKSNRGLMPTDIVISELLEVIKSKPEIKNS